jgi:integrase/predicted metal-dependent hydrolase
MASPIRRNGSSVHYLRKRVPADLTDKAVGLVLHVPLGDETAVVKVGRTGTIKVSLRTHDPREAKARQAKALAYLDDMWRSLRDGERRLTNRQVVALAGEWYRAAKLRWEDDPGRATIWNILNTAATKWDAAAVQREMAPYVHELLAQTALRADEDSRVRLAVAMHRALVDATALLERRGRGDYGPDEVEHRFPEWEPDAKPNGQAGSSITALFAGWELESRAAGLTDKTISEYKSVLTRFAAFVGHDDATRLTPHDVVGWKDKRLADGRSPKTVKDVDLSAMKSVFGWCVRNHKLKSNPAHGITLKLGKKTRGRPKGFTDDEAEAILKACQSHVGATREHEKTAAAKRWWLPWLCAYSGARIGEVAQLRREDVRREGDHWVTRITPEAGPVKNKEAREVPLHPHLIELGFIEFVTASAKGYLFLTASKDGEVKGKLRALKNRLGEFVRAIVSDKRVAPNHGWRHRFITKSRKYGLDQEKRRMITGHAGENVDERVYGDPAGLYVEVCKLPCYGTASSSRVLDAAE